MSRSTLRIVAFCLGLTIFMVDLLTPLEGAVAVLYVVVVLIAARTGRSADLYAAAGGAAFLTITAFLLSHGLGPPDTSAMRALVSLAAIAIVVFLAAQNQAATATLDERAKLLDLSHDMIVVRDRRGAVTLWNRTAEEIYGWSSAEAQGRVADELLKTVYPAGRESIEAQLLRSGRWDGTVEQSTRAGAKLFVQSRWALQRDEFGRVARVFETYTDVSERKAQNSALVRSESRYRHMFDASRIGIAREDWSLIRAEIDAVKSEGVTDIADYLARNSGFVARAKALVRIIDVNPAFREITRGGTATQAPVSLDEFLADTDRTFPASLLAFARGSAFVEGETEIRTVAGNLVPVLFAITFPPDAHGEVLVFIVDITERKKAQEQLLSAQTALAQASRIATLGEFTATITHEVNQPLMAVVTSGEAAMRWLRRDKPDIGEAVAAISRSIVEGRRASEIISRVRNALRKTPPPRQVLVISAIVQEAALLVEHEIARAGAVLTIDSPPDLPPVSGDRIQLQQVLVNLMLNAAQALSGQAAPRLVTVRSRVEGADVIVSVEDNGPGVTSVDAAQLFQPFFTSKQHGMGIGLAICFSTAEAHGGHLSLDSTPRQGARFVLTLPAIEV